jgi:hypothetical protein
LASTFDQTGIRGGRISTPGQGGGQFLVGRLHQLGVKRPGHGQAHRFTTFGFDEFLGRGDGGRLTRQGRVPRTQVVCDPEAARGPRFVDDLFDPTGVEQ